MLPRDGAAVAPHVQPCRCRRFPDCDDGGVDRARIADRLGRGPVGVRLAGRRHRRRPGRGRRGLPSLPGRLPVIGTLFSTPRPEPGHLLPALAGGLVLLVGLPVFVVTGWSLAGWGLATVLYVAV